MKNTLTIDELIASGIRLKHHTNCVYMREDTEKTTEYAIYTTCNLDRIFLTDANDKNAVAIEYKLTIPWEAFNIPPIRDEILKDCYGENVNLDTSHLILPDVFYNGKYIKEVTEGTMINIKAKDIENISQTIQDINNYTNYARNPVKEIKFITDFHLGTHNNKFRDEINKKIDSLTMQFYSDVSNMILTEVEKEKSILLAKGIVFD